MYLDGILDGEKSKCGGFLEYFVEYFLVDLYNHIGLYHRHSGEVWDSNLSSIQFMENRGDGWSWQVAKVDGVGECDVDCEADRDGWGCNDQLRGTDSPGGLSKGLQPALSHYYPLQSTGIEKRKLLASPLPPLLY